MLCIVTMTLKVVIQYATNVMYRDYDKVATHDMRPMLCIVTQKEIKVDTELCTKPMLCIVTHERRL